MQHYILKKPDLNEFSFVLLTLILLLHFLVKCQMK